MNEITGGKVALLWRVVYHGHASTLSDSWDAGPWHPDKQHAEHCAQWLRTLGHHAEVQNNTPGKGKTPAF